MRTGQELIEERSKEAQAVYHPNHGKPYQKPESRSIYDLLRRRVAIDPTAIAIVAPDRPPLTYRSLLQQTESTASALRAFGVERNDNVAIVLSNGPEMAVAFLSIAAAAACAPLNPAYRKEEFDFYLSDLKARAVIVAAGAESPILEVAREHGIQVLRLTPGLEAGTFTLSGEKRRAVPSNTRFAESDDTALVLHTSGTTSRAKMVPLTHANICTSAHNIAITLDLTERDRCLNVMPLFHIHGLIGALSSSLTAGGSVVCSPGFDAKKFFLWLDDFKPTWYSAVPTIHQAVLAAAPANRDIIARRPMRFIRSSSASLPPAVMKELEEILQTQVVEAYGMTEAAHQMASNPLAPLPRKPGSVGIAAGPDIAIMGPDGALLQAGEDGEIVISGVNVTLGYANNPAANASAFSNGWFRTGDQGRFDEDGYLYLTGRLKEMINRGGEKIAPREIDDVLTHHPAIAQALAFAVPHPTLSEDVAAVVVLKNGANVTEREIRDFAGERLAAFKVPTQVLILDEIPKGPTGKPQRIGLAGRLASKLAEQRQQNFVSGTTATENEVIAIWKDQLRLENIGLRDDFQMLGGDSLAIVAMLNRIRGQYNVEIPIEDFLRAPSVETIVRIIEGKNSPLTADDKAKPIRDSFFSGIRNRLFQILALYAPGYTTMRVWLHRQRGVTIGDNTSIGLSAIIETAYPRLVSIGNNVSIGMRAIIIGHLRDSTDRARATGQHTVRIEDDAYIGPGVIILPNVTIGKGAVVSAGSVISKSVPPNTLVQGNPAKVVARCGKSLGGGVSYEEFLRHLKPIEESSEK